jgi:hypothetical protein
MATFKSTTVTIQIPKCLPDRMQIGIGLERLLQAVYREYNIVCVYRDIERI